MSDDVQIGKSCSECGEQYDHLTGCPNASKPPPVSYDLAEFERQLENLNNDLFVRQEFAKADIVCAIIGCLRASKREGKS